MLFYKNSQFADQPCLNDKCRRECANGRDRDRESVHDRADADATLRSIVWEYFFLVALESKPAKSMGSARLL